MPFGRKEEKQEGFNANLLGDNNLQTTGAAAVDATKDLANQAALSSAAEQQEEGKRYYEELLNLAKGQANAKAQEAVEEKRNAAIGGIADMGRALANLYFTTKGAPNAYEHAKESMGEKSRERYERARAQRDANRAAYINYALNIGKMKDSREQARALAAARAAEKAETLAEHKRHNKEMEGIAKKKWEDQLPIMQQNANSRAKQVDIEEKRVYVTAAKGSKGSGGGSGSKVVAFSTKYGDVEWEKDKAGKTYGYNLKEAVNFIKPEELILIRKSKNTKGNNSQLEDIITTFLDSDIIPEERKQKLISHMRNIGVKKAATQQAQKPKKQTKTQL